MDHHSTSTVDRDSGLVAGALLPPRRPRHGRQHYLLPIRPADVPIRMVRLPPPYLSKIVLRAGAGVTPVDVPHLRLPSLIQPCVRRDFLVKTAYAHMCLRRGSRGKMTATKGHRLHLERLDHVAHQCTVSGQGPVGASRN